MGAATAVRLTATGMWTPARVLSNADLEKMVETSEEWIIERTGIRERRIADDATTAVGMGTLAARETLREVDVDPQDVDAIIVSTATPDRLLPATACDIQAELGADSAVAFDVIGACSGWLYALSIAQGLIATGQARRALCIATEKMSSIIDWSDRRTCVLFGDAAGAALVEASTDPGRGIIAHYMRSDGRLADILYRPPSSAQPTVVDAKDRAARNGYLRMEGREVFKSAVRSMCEAVDAVLERAGVTRDDVDLLLPHQANIRIIEATARYAGIPIERVWINVDRYGNTSSASIPISLHEARCQDRIVDGSLVLMVTFGAGLTWAATLVRW